MQKIKLIFICIFLCFIVVFLTFKITKEITWQLAKNKYTKILNTTHGNIVYSISSNKQDLLLYSSSTIVGNMIEYLNTDSSDRISEYEDICPMLNTSFKKAILDSYNKTKQFHKNDQNLKNDVSSSKIDSKIINFNKGYEKLKNYCNK